MKSPDRNSRKTAAERELRIGPGPTRSELFAAGKTLRETCPRTSHAEWKPPADRRDPVELMESSDKGRIPELIPIRHGRMLRSPFTFYRGAALNMAADLAGTPATGMRVQACGDCPPLQFRRVRDARTAGRSSISTTWTRRCPHRGSGT